MRLTKKYPVPALNRRYHFARMWPGMAMSVPIPPEDPRAGDRALRAAYAYGKRNGMQFTGKKVRGRRGNFTMRIWRVK